jgi:hypothetical protein
MASEKVKYLIDVINHLLVAAVDHPEDHARVQHQLRGGFTQVK